MLFQLRIQRHRLLWLVQPSVGRKTMSSHPEEMPPPCGSRVRRLPVTWMARSYTPAPLRGGCAGATVRPRWGSMSNFLPGTINKIGRGFSAMLWTTALQHHYGWPGALPLSGAASRSLPCWLLPFLVPMIQSSAIIPSSPSLENAGDVIIASAPPPPGLMALSGRCPRSFCHSWPGDGSYT